MFLRQNRKVRLSEGNIIWFYQVIVASVNTIGCNLNEITKSIHDIYFSVYNKCARTLWLNTGDVLKKRRVRMRGKCPEVKKDFQMITCFKRPGPS